MEHNKMFTCRKCNKLLYSQLELSKIIDEKLPKEIKETNLQVVAEDGFHSDPYLCEDCFNAVNQIITKNGMNELEQTRKWDEEEAKLKNIKNEISENEIEDIRKGRDNTKTMYDTIKLKREKEDDIFLQTLMFKDDLESLEEYTKLIEEEYWKEYDKLFEEYQLKYDVLNNLKWSEYSLQEELNKLENDNIIKSQFLVEAPKFSTNSILNFNSSLGKFITSLYLLGKKLIPYEQYTTLIPMDERSQITVISKEDKKKRKFNLYFNKNAWQTDEINFQEGFKCLVNYFNIVIEKIIDTWPVFFMDCRYSLKSINMSMYDSQLKVSHSLVFKNTEEWNKAMREMTDLLNYILGSDKIYNLIYYSCSSVPSNINTFIDIKEDDNLTVSNDVQCIGDYFFSKKPKVKSITMSEGVIELGNWCFNECNNLSKVELPNTITSLGISCFYECIELTSITLSSNLTILCDRCFSGCSKLVNIKIPDSVVSFGDNCFFRCCNLRSINVPSSITHIGDYCFGKCAKLDSLIIPTTVVYLGTECFYKCSAFNSKDNIIEDYVSETK